MYNIVQMESALKGYSDDQLASELKAPSGSVPQFLVMTELKRRNQMRAEAGASPQPKTTVKEEMLQGIGGLPMGQNVPMDADVTGAPQQMPLPVPKPQGYDPGMTRDITGAPQRFAGGGYVARENEYMSGIGLGNIADLIRRANSGDPQASAILSQMSQNRPPHKVDTTGQVPDRTGTYQPMFSGGADMPSAVDYGQYERSHRPPPKTWDEMVAEHEAYMEANPSEPRVSPATRFAESPYRTQAGKDVREIVGGAKGVWDTVTDPIAAGARGAYNATKTGLENLQGYLNDPYVPPREGASQGTPYVPIEGPAPGQASPYNESPATVLDMPPEAQPSSPQEMPTSPVPEAQGPGAKSEIAGGIAAVTPDFMDIMEKVNKRFGGSPEMERIMKDLVKQTEDIQKGYDEDKNLALAKMGFAMAAGESPYFATNVGAGGEAGIEALQGAKQQYNKNLTTLLGAQGSLAAAREQAKRGNLAAAASFYNSTLDAQTAQAQIGMQAEALRRKDPAYLLDRLKDMSPEDRALYLSAVGKSGFDPVEQAYKAVDDILDTEDTLYVENLRDEISKEWGVDAERVTLPMIRQYLLMGFLGKSVPTFDASGNKLSR